MRLTISLPRSTRTCSSCVSSGEKLVSDKLIGVGEFTGADLFDLASLDKWIDESDGP